MWSPKDVSHHDLGINCDKTQISQITIQINRALAGSVLKKSISSPIDLCILSTTACQGWYFSTRAYEFLFLVRLFLDERWENGNSCFLSFHVEKLRHCRPVSSGLPINPKHIITNTHRFWREEEDDCACFSQIWAAVDVYLYNALISKWAADRYIAASLPRRHWTLRHSFASFWTTLSTWHTSSHPTLCM